MPRGSGQLDWIVSDAGWSPGVVQVSPGTALLGPLSSSNAQQLHLINPTLLRPDAPETSADMVVERIRGHIHWLFPEATPEQTSEQFVDLSIEVLDADLDGLPLIPGDYDLSVAWTANRALMWHESAYHVNLTSFWADRPGYGVFGRFDVDIKCKRRIENNQVLSLVVDNDVNISSSERFSFISRLRTLVSY